MQRLLGLGVKKTLKIQRMCRMNQRPMNRKEEKRMSMLSHRTCIVSLLSRLANFLVVRKQKVMANCPNKTAYWRARRMESTVPTRTFLQRRLKLDATLKMFFSASQKLMAAEILEMTYLLNRQSAVFQ